jgi:electron transfer flavoprotein alpha subunit
MSACACTARASLFRSFRSHGVVFNARSILTARLLSSLAVLEHRGGKVSSGSLPTVAAATKLGGSVTAFVAGSDSKTVAEEAAKIQGVEKVLYVPNGAYDKVDPVPELCNHFQC